MMVVMLLIRQGDGGDDDCADSGGDNDYDGFGDNGRHGEMEESSDDADVTLWR